jgi:hypothetical protein
MWSGESRFVIGNNKNILSKTQQLIGQLGGTILESISLRNFGVRFSKLDHFITMEKMFYSVKTL